MSRLTSRRAFIAGTSTVAAGALTGAGLARHSALANPASTGATVRPLAYTSAASGPAPADWTALKTDLQGHLVRPGDASYSLDKELYDPRFDGLTPAGIAYCATFQDVQACLAFSRKFGVQVAARSGGHSYAGWSSCAGLIVDVTRMNVVKLSGTTAEIGSGAKLIDVYSGLAAHGRAIPGGSCPTVGIAGLTLGGGIGVTGRAHGLTCDNLASVDIVVADGTVYQATPTQHADLFWACQGGGGGNFGVVTQFSFNTFATTPILTFFLRWNWSQAADVVRGWQSWAPAAPDALWSNLHLSAATHGSEGVTVGGTYLGSESALLTLLGKLYSAVGPHPFEAIVTPHSSYLDAMLYEAGCSGETVAACRLPSQGPSGTFPRVPQYAKSDFFNRPLTSAGIGTMLTWIEKFPPVAGAAGGSGGIALDALGGAINRVAPSATAFVHRSSLFDAQYTTNWSSGTGGTGAANQHAWLRSFWTAMRPYASGQAYQNYIDPDLTANWRSAYYGANTPRLEAIKKAYDPTRLFRFPQAI